MRPRLAFAALLTTSLVAVAVPAAAASSDASATPPGVAAITQQLSPAGTPSPTASPSSGTGSTTAGTQSTAATTVAPAAAPTTAPTTAPATTSPSGSNPATCIQAAGANLLGVLNCVTPTGGTNPLTGLISQLQALAAGGGAPGLSPAPFTALAACVQGQLTKTPPDGAAIEGCFSTFAKALTGAPQATCLDPILKGTITAVQDLVQNQNPTPLQNELTGLQGQLTSLASCLQGASTPAASPTVTTGTTTSSGGATTPSNPTDAVPVSATPTFTG